MPDMNDEEWLVDEDLQDSGCRDEKAGYRQTRGNPMSAGDNRFLSHIHVVLLFGMLHPQI